MKTTYAVIGLGLLVSACASGTGAIPAAEIDKMSNDSISVVYYDSISGMGDATQIASAHCKPRKAIAGGRTDGGAMPDTTIVSFQCK